MLRKFWRQRNKNKIELAEALNLMGMELAGLQKKVSQQQVMIDEMVSQMSSSGSFSNAAANSARGIVVTSDLTALENRLRLLYIQMSKGSENA